MFREARQSVLIAALLLVALAGTAYAAQTGPGTLGPLPAFTAPEPVGPSPALVSEGFAVYFTDPGRDGFRGGPETALLAAIDAARVTVDVAAYDLNLWGLRDALIDAHRRGVQVRLVLEADNRETAEVDALAAAGIPIAADRPDGLMHDKFVVIDRRQVWTGSMNFTLNGAYRNDNHLMALVSPAAVAAYEVEFEEMFAGGLFGAFSPEGEPAVFLLAGPEGDFAAEVYFAPDDAPLSRIVALLDGAQESIRFMAFSFTSDAIGEAMLARAAAGVDVRGVFDESQLESNAGSEYDFLLAAGLDVRIDGNPYKLHHKVILIDGRIVIAGSYNFSASAETRNDENVVILFDEAVARAFLVEWERVFAQGKK